jgi:hypothetical protein
VRHADIRRYQVGPEGGVVLEVPRVVTVRLEPRLRTVVVRWLRYDDVAVKPALEQQLDLIVRQGLRSVIVDSADAVGTYSPAMNRWIGTEFVPRMRTTDVRVLVTVVPRSSLAAMANKEWQDGGQRVGMRMAEVPSMADAERLAREAMDAAMV